MTAGQDHWSAFELPRLLDIDPAWLDQTFRARSRELHPDRCFVDGPEAVDRAMLASSRLNDAYRALRDPFRRAETLLHEEGLTTSGKYSPPPDMLLQVLDWNELLDEDPADPLTRVAIEELSAELDGREQADREALDAIAQTWDDEVKRAVQSGGRSAMEPERTRLLDALRSLLARRGYLENLRRRAANVLGTR